MTISLCAKTQRLLEEKLRSGSYNSPDEVIHAALEAMNSLDLHTLDDATANAVDRAEDEIEQERVHDWSEVRKQVRAMFLRR